MWGSAQGALLTIVLSSPGLTGRSSNRCPLSHNPIRPASHSRSPELQIGLNCGNLRLSSLKETQIMGEFVNLVVPFFSTPTNYSEMLKKLAGFAFYQVFIITLLLRQIPEVNAWFNSIETFGKLGELVSALPNWENLNVLGIFIGILVALISNIFHLHDRISDILRIRSRFDKRYILIPLAQNVGATITPRMSKAIDDHRDSLMRDVFYRFASSKSDNPVVDKHDIEHALNAWAWFWAFVEA
jgi:hypothetical protein